MNEISGTECYVCNCDVNEAPLREFANGEQGVRVLNNKEKKKDYAL